MDLDKRAMIEIEDKYSFNNSLQISSQCGLIGYLRADINSDNKGFFGRWFDYCKDLKTDEFIKEFDDVVNSLREDGDILNNRKSLAGYCYSNPQSRMKTDIEYYGVRVNTDKYAYLFRLNPNNGEYNIYCYCYRKDMLDSHIQQAQKGIRFITPQYEEIFRIPDGDTVRIVDSNDLYIDECCRYIDDYHLQVGQKLYHICQFAEIMEANGNTVIPIRSNLPDYCFSVDEETGKMIIIKKGETGYFNSDLESNDKIVSRMIAKNNNKKLGVSEMQEKCMIAGATLGWEKPEANPQIFCSDEKSIKMKNNVRGDAR